ncbi:MAG: HAD family hydrolase [Thermoplasmata archaeon]|jgi:HAD superfamily hydrolase (TIGR01549 family)|nr:HAD family hydrolase [Thermoplasmata archaeon]
MDASEGSAPPFLEPLLGVVFDLDGTLVLSDHDFHRMRKEAIRLAERAGVIPGHLHPDQTIVEIVSGALTELEASGVPDGPRFRFEAEVNRTIDAIEMEALPKTRARDGAVALLAALAKRGFRLGVLTRSSSEFCRAALERTGLLAYFPYLRTRSAPGPAKPDPEALRLLLHEMGIPVDRALFVGDHRFDAECATRASVRFYAILPPDGGEPGAADRFRANGAAAIARDLAELAQFLDVAAVPAG